MAVWSQVKLSSFSDDFRFDAEYYRPEVLALRRSVNAGRWPTQTVEQLSESVINFGAYSLCNEIDFLDDEGLDDASVRFITAQDIQDGFIDFANARWISRKQHAGLLSKSQVSSGQVLVAMAARLGHAAVYEGSDPLNSSQDIAKISIRDPKQVDPHYLSVYLNSRIGRGLLLASQTGSVQQHTNLGRIKSTQVVILPYEQQRLIASVYRRAIEKRQSTARTVDAAESLLLKYLGLDHLDLSAQKYYTRSFADLHSADRFGAEYFMPCKQRVLNALAKMPHRKIVDLAPNIQLLWDPAQAARGEEVRNYDLTDALEPFLEDIPPQLGAEIGSTKKRMQNGDVVISRLRSYLKEIAVVRTTDIVPTIGSSEFIVLRPKSGGISAETLMIYLRCSLVQTVLKWSQDGSNHPRFNAEDLVAIPVPDAVLQAQGKIDALVKKSREQRSEALELLAQAKQTVEDMITGASARKGR